jgi:hypothetical protein
VSLNRRQRIGLVALLTALVSLMMDRLLLTAEPATALAGVSESPPLSGQAERGGPAAQADAGVGAWLQSLGGEIDAARQAAQTSSAAKGQPAPADVFDWQRLGGLLAGGPGGATAADEDAEQRAEQFRGKHTLVATLLGPSPMALVGERTLHIGDSLDGFRLSAVRSGEADFVSDDVVVVLQVPRRAPKP